MRTKRVLAVPDIHAPFHDQKAVDEVYAIAKFEKPDVVVQLGDMVDLFHYSRFPHDRNLMTPREELQEARAFVENFWANLRKILPRARLVQLAGNHGVRITKRILECLPALFGVVDIDRIFRVDGVELLAGERDFVEIDNVLYIHGTFVQAGHHMRYFEQSVVRAHSHKASIQYVSRKKTGTLFECECGWLGDDSQIPFNYFRTHCTQWTKSVAVVDERGPRIVLV